MFSILSCQLTKFYLNSTRKAIFYELFCMFKIYFAIGLAINISILIQLNYKNKTIA